MLLLGTGTRPATCKPMGMGVVRLEIVSGGARGGFKWLDQGSDQNKRKTTNLARVDAFGGLLPAEPIPTLF